LRSQFNKETIITEGLVDDRIWNALHTTVLLNGSTVIPENIVRNLKDINKIPNTTNEYYYPELDYIFKSNNNNNETIISKVKQYLEDKDNRPPPMSMAELPVVKNNLKAYFSFDNTLKEIQSNTSNATATTITYNTVSGKTGILCPSTPKSYSNTSTAYIHNFNIPNLSLTASNGVSISVWFYSTNLSTTPKSLYVLDHPEGRNNWLGLGYCCAVRSNGFNFWCANYAKYITNRGYACYGYTDTLTISNNTWHHLVMLFDKTNKIQGYLNGNSVELNKATQVEVNVNSLDITKEDNRISIGCSSQITNNFTDGTISKLAIYNTVLTPAEITALYQAG
jgi:hypothetical protein